LGEENGGTASGAGDGLIFGVKLGAKIVGFSR